MIYIYTPFLKRKYIYIYVCVCVGVGVYFKGSGSRGRLDVKTPTLSGLRMCNMRRTPTKLYCNLQTIEFVIKHVLHCFSRILDQIYMMHRRASWQLWPKVRVNVSVLMC